MKFYIHKKAYDEKYSIINNNIINITDSDDDLYSMWYDDKIYSRYKKLNVILKNNKDIVFIIDLIDFCNSIKMNQEEVITNILSNELSKEINKQILKNVMLLGNNKNNKI